MTDSMVHDGLWCPFENRHMAGSAEVIAAEYDVSRREQDEFAARSHRLAAVASGEGWFDLEIIPVLTKGRKGEDQHHFGRRRSQAGFDAGIAR